MPQLELMSLVCSSRRSAAAALCSASRYQPDDHREPLLLLPLSTARILPPLTDRPTLTDTPARLSVSVCSSTSAEDAVTRGASP